MVILAFMVLSFLGFAYFVYMKTIARIYNLNKIHPSYIAITCVLIVISLFPLTYIVQRGYVLQGLAPFLLFVSPPEDLFEPIAKVRLDPSKDSYTFKFTHKYLGNHELRISFPGESLNKIENDLYVSIKIADGNRTLLEKSSREISGIFGNLKRGINFIDYKVPKDLPVSHELVAVVVVKGSIGDFVKQNGPADIIITHGSEE
jgi:hypothetical protein